MKWCLSIDIFPYAQDIEEVGGENKDTFVCAAWSRWGMFPQGYYSHPRERADG